MYPLSLGFPLLLSCSIHALLWYGTFWHIDWLNRLAVLGLSAGGLAGASIALVFYRVLALEKPWSLSIIICSLLQFAALANSVLFLYAAYTGTFPAWMR